MIVPNFLSLFLYHNVKDRFFIFIQTSIVYSNSASFSLMYLPYFIENWSISFSKWITRSVPFFSTQYQPAFYCRNPFFCNKDWQTVKTPMYRAFAVCSETVKTDKRLTTFTPEISCIFARISCISARISCTAARISCTAARISCRSDKFSREFQSYTADLQKTLRGLSFSPMINSENRCHT